MKNSPNEKALTETKRLMARLAAMPHKLHVQGKSAKKKTTNTQKKESNQ